MCCGERSGNPVRMENVIDKIQNEFVNAGTGDNDKDKEREAEAEVRRRQQLVTNNTEWFLRLLANIFTKQEQHKIYLYMQ